MVNLRSCYINNGRLICIRKPLYILLLWRCNIWNKTEMGFCNMFINSFVSKIKWQPLCSLNLSSTTFWEPHNTMWKQEWVYASLNTHAWLTYVPRNHLLTLSPEKPIRLPELTNHDSQGNLWRNFNNWSFLCPPVNFKKSGSGDCISYIVTQGQKSINVFRSK